MTNTNDQPITMAELGERVGVGRTAEVFARGPEEVVKLLRPSIPDVIGEQEARVAALVDAAAIGAPRFLGTVRIDGRIGLVYERIDGPSMLDRLSQRPWEMGALARRFAELQVAMTQGDGTGLPEQRAAIGRMIERARPWLPEATCEAALARLQALPSGGSICHGDLHPGNVLLSARGPVIIDWMSASRGSAAGEIARTLFLLGDSAIPDHLPGWQRGLVALVRRRFGAVYRRRVRELLALETAEVAAWRLPLLAARLGEGIDGERAAVLAAIRAEMAE